MSEERESSIALKHSKGNGVGQRFLLWHGDTGYELSVCVRKKELPGRGVHREKVRETGRR